MATTSPVALSTWSVCSSVARSRSVLARSRHALGSSMQAAQAPCPSGSAWMNGYSREL